MNDYAEALEMAQGVFSRLKDEVIRPIVVGNKDWESDIPNLLAGCHAYFAVALLGGISGGERKMLNILRCTAESIYVMGYRAGMKAAELPTLVVGEERADG